jgi:hypothetical protein
MLVLDLNRRWMNQEEEKQKQITAFEVDTQWKNSLWK